MRILPTWFAIEFPRFIGVVLFWQPTRRTGMHCKNCGAPLRRLARKGFLQLKVYPVFGLYPWECPLCRKELMVKKQYVRKRRSVQQHGAD
jgi:hypothetical protein